MKVTGSDIGLAGKVVRPRMIKKMIRPRPKDGHKNTFGHCLIVAGSEGKGGAAVIAAKAALRTGCGLVTVLLPGEYECVLLQHVPEAMVIKRGITPDLSKYSSVAFGPGAGTSPESAELLFSILSNYKGKLVIDADGLTILSQHKDWQKMLSGRAILTPHTGEFERITTKYCSLQERVQAQQEFAQHTGATILLKGRNTTIATGNELYINQTGNNGMATAGTGDALTGIIVSLCAQDYACKDAAVLGAYLHGYAGDIAAKELSEYSMLASDLTDRIGRFFLKFT